MNKFAYFSEKLLEILGIFETRSKWTSGRLKIVMYTSMVVFLFVTEVPELMHSTDDFRHFNETLCMTLIGVMGITKYINLSYYRERMMGSRDDINGDKINEEKSKSDDLVIENYDRAGLKLSKAIAYMNFILGAGATLQSLPDILLGNERWLPYAGFYPFSLDPTGSFIIAYIQQLLAGYVFTMLFAATNAWLIFLTYHACGHYCVLQNYLERIAEDEDWAEYQPMDTGERIAKCVRLHQNICKMAEDIEDYFTLPNVIHFLVSAIAICTSGYELSTGLNGPQQLVKHICAIIAQFAQLLVVNWCGQLITDKSFGVSLAVYRSNFYKLEVCYQKDLAVIVLRAQRPMYLTAGKFYNLSLESIANILKASMSCFAMFANIESNAA